jgi:hypothetical protein
MSLLFGLRGINAGSDTSNYVSAFNDIATNFNSYQELARTFVMNGITAAEPSFMLFAYVMKVLGFSAEFYLVAVVFVSLYLIYLAHVRLVSHPLLCLVLYMVSISAVSLHANVIRQGMAVGFVLLAISFIQVNKNKPAIFAFIIASTFHFSAVAAAFFVIPAMRKMKLKYYWFSFFLLVFLLSSGLLSNLITLGLPRIFAIKLARYFQVGFESLLTFKVLNFFIFVLGLEVAKKYSPRNIESIDNIYRCYFSFFLLQLLFVGNIIASERFGLYRFILEPIIIVIFVSAFREKKFVKIILSILVFIYGCIVYNIPGIKNMLTG